MQPTLHDGDWLVYRTGRQPNIGDLVVFRGPDDESLVRVKRVRERHQRGLIVIGDNYQASTDSRVFGPVPEHAVIGVVWGRMWPRPRRFSSRLNSLD